MKTLLKLYNLAWIIMRQITMKRLQNLFQIKGKVKLNGKKPERNRSWSRNLFIFVLTFFSTVPASDLKMNPNNWVLVSNLLCFADAKEKVEALKVQICFSMVPPFKETLCYLLSITSMLKLQCQKKHQPILPFYEATIFLNARILMEPSAPH